MTIDCFRVRKMRIIRGFTYDATSGIVCIFLKVSIRAPYSNITSFVIPRIVSSIRVDTQLEYFNPECAIILGRAFFMLSLNTSPFKGKPLPCPASKAADSTSFCGRIIYSSPNHCVEVAWLMGSLPFLFPLVCVPTNWPKH